MNDRIDFERMREQRGALLEALQAAGAEISRDGRSIKCPFHEDKHASASIYQSKTDGGWRFKCQSAGCGVSGDLFDVRAIAGGISRAEAIKAEAAGQTVPKADGIRQKIERAPDAKAKGGTVYANTKNLEDAAVWSVNTQYNSKAAAIARCYEYREPSTGHIDLLVMRIEIPGVGKSFRQAVQVDGGWAMRGPEGLWPIYRRKEIEKAYVVVVVEGEKTVEALVSVGIEATTNPAGAGKAGKADWSPLSGKPVILWPDNDAVDPKTGKRTGIEHMREVAEILGKLRPAPLVRWLDPEGLGLGDKGDAADLVERLRADGMSDPEIRSAIMLVLGEARPLGALGALHLELKAAASGERYSVPLPWPALSQDCRALLPGTVTILCGSPGSTKSFALLQALRFWIAGGAKSCALELEDGIVYHLRRALAQVVGNSNLTVDEWVKENAQAMQEAQLQAQADLIGVAEGLEELPEEKPPTVSNLIQWVATKAEQGNRIIAIDPITAMVKGRNAWQDEESFLFGAKKIIEKHKCSLVLITHPRKLPSGQNRGAVGMDDMAGGVAFSRFSQTILWLAKVEPHEAQVETSMGNVAAWINRTFCVHKSRNGAASGLRKYGCHFDGRTLTLQELGVIAEDG